MTVKYACTSFGSTIQCVVTIIAFVSEVVGMSVGSGFPVLSSRGWLLREHVWENQNICASRSLRFRSNFAGRFALGCRSTFQSPHKIFWREPWNWHTPQYWPNIGTIYGSTNEPRHSVQEQATNKTPSSHHYLTLKEFLGQHHLATPASQKTRAIIPWRHKWSSWK